jgi:hypothetical protein
VKWWCIWRGFNRDKTWHGCLVRDLHGENVCVCVKKSEGYGEEIENEREGERLRRGQLGD